VSVEQFLRFFAHPARYLAQERLGIRLEAEEGLLEAREPFVLDPLAAYNVREALFRGTLQGRAPAEIQAVARGGGLLPQGAVGDVFLAREVARAEHVARRLADWAPIEPRDSVSVDLDLGSIRLRGRLGNLTTRGHLMFRCGSTRAKDHLTLWIAHLLLNRLGAHGVAPASWFLAEDGALRLTPVSEADAELRRLADLYWAGCSRVLPLLLEPGYAFATRRHAGRDREAALSAARKAWETTEWKRGEDSDPYHRLVFRAIDPLDEAFCDLAEAVFLPLLAHEEVI
jgi:exodeoxyribonuclease V gamma subunit